MDDFPIADGDFSADSGRTSPIVAVWVEQGKGKGHRTWQFVRPPNLVLTIFFIWTSCSTKFWAGDGVSPRPRPRRILQCISWMCLLFWRRLRCPKYRDFRPNVRWGFGVYWWIGVTESLRVCGVLVDLSGLRVFNGDLMRIYNGDLIHCGQKRLDFSHTHGV